MSVLLLARLKRVIARLVAAEVAWADSYMRHSIHLTKELQQAREVYNKLLKDLEQS